MLCRTKGYQWSWWCIFMCPKIHWVWAFYSSAWRFNHKIIGSTHKASDECVRTRNKSAISIREVSCDGVNRHGIVDGVNIGEEIYKISRLKSRILTMLRLIWQLLEDMSRHLIFLIRLKKHNLVLTVKFNFTDALSNEMKSTVSCLTVRFSTLKSDGKGYAYQSIS